MHKSISKALFKLNIQYFFSVFKWNKVLWHQLHDKLVGQLWEQWICWQSLSKAVIQLQQFNSSSASSHRNDRSKLKGHGNETDFLGFLQKLVPHESLTLPFEPFRFWLRIRVDIRIRKTTPRYHRYGESPTPRITDTGSRQLTALLIRGVADTPHH